MAEKSKLLEESGSILNTELLVEDPNVRDFRNRLTTFLDMAYWTSLEGKEATTQYYSLLETKFGLEIVEEMDPTRPHYRCVQYVFGTVKHEPWVKEEARWTQDFLDHAFEYLWTMGYRPVGNHDKPIVGDIIGYRMVQGFDHINSFLHFGLVVGEDLVQSKFNNGPVIKHKIDQVPRTFGSLICNEAVFFRKISA